MKHELNGMIGKILPIRNQVDCLWYQNMHILMAYIHDILLIISNGRDKALNHVRFT